MYEMSVPVAQPWQRLDGKKELVIRTFSLAALKLDAEFIQASYGLDAADWGIKHVKHNGIPIYTMSHDRRVWDDDGKEVK